MTETPRRVTRRQAFRGQQVTVALRNGQRFSGSLDGWGTQLLRLRDAAGVREFAACNVDRVEA